MSTVNNVIGEFAPKEFIIDAGTTLDYMLDVDLADFSRHMLQTAEGMVLVYNLDSDGQLAK